MSHPGVENSPCVPYWAWTSGHVCLRISSRHPLWSLWEELQGVQALCRRCRIVATEFNWGVSFSATSSVSWLLFFCIALHARARSQVFHQISVLFWFFFCVFKYKSDCSCAFKADHCFSSFHPPSFNFSQIWVSKSIIMKKGSYIS